MKNKINNQIYEQYGERWYTEDRDPVALLREEGRFKNDWIRQNCIQGTFSVLDLGCGGGFLTNALSLDGHEVTGVDIGQSCLSVAKNHDETKRVRYVCSDIAGVPFEDESFDVVCLLDVLEHVENPMLVLEEASRVLRKNGRLFFHTFNRNFVSYFIIIKLVEWFVPNTPKNMHVLSMFIKPEELQRMLLKNALRVQYIKGIRPVIFNASLLRSVILRRVIPGIEFKWCRSTIASYAGVAVKF